MDVSRFLCHLPNAELCFSAVFTCLLHSLLQQELAAKNVEVSTQKEIIQRLHAARPEAADQQAVYYVDLG